MRWPRRRRIINSVLPEYARLYRNDGDDLSFCSGSCNPNSNERLPAFITNQQELGHQRISERKEIPLHGFCRLCLLSKDGDDMMSLTKNVGYALEASKRNGKKQTDVL